MKKYSNQKKGFTLIELLAVIVILAVIALIAVPITLNVIEDSKKASIKVGATHYIDALEDELQYEQIEEELDSEGTYIIQEDGSYIANGEVKKLSMKGGLPSSGTICVDEKGLVESYSVVLDGYVVTNTSGEQKIEAGTTPKSLTCNVTEEQVEIVIPENAGICSQDKKVEIKYPEYEEIAKEYSLDRENWKEYTGIITLTENTTLYARLRDTRNDKVSSLASLTFTKIDNTKMDKTEGGTTSPSLVLSTEKPTSEVNVTFRQTDNCGIDKSTIEYGISTTKDGEYKYQKESVFKGLDNNTRYYIRTKVNDIAGNGIVESEISEITTKDFGICNITISNYGEWTTSKDVTITGETVKGTTLQYRVYKSSTKEDTEFIDITSGYKTTLDVMATEEEPTHVYCRYVEYNENEEIINVVDPAISSSITKTDITAPELVLGNIVKSTNSITIPISTNSDSESGIKSTTCEYGTSTSYGSTGTISNNKCEITKLKNNTTYYYKVTTTNNAGLSTSVIGSTTTGEFEGITITPSSTGWTTSKNVTISGTTEGAVLQYKVVSGTTTQIDWTEYTDSILVNWNSTTTTPTHIYARFSDGTNYSAEETLTITEGVDTTAPSLTLGTESITTSTITIPITKNSDSESGITKTTCVYGTSTNYGSTGNISNNKCIISKLNDATKYYYKIVTTNNAGLSTTKTGSTTTGEFAGITITPSSTSWTPSKTVTISGVTEGAVLQYKIESGTTLKKDWTEYSDAITIDWAADTTTPTTIYARFNDGTNSSAEETLSITTIDTTTPSLTINSVTKGTTNLTITYTSTDSQSGIKNTICSYGTSTSYGKSVTGSNNKCEISGLAKGTTYYYKIVTTNTAGLTTTKTGNTKTGTDGISFELTQTPTGTTYAQSKTVKVTYTATEITNPTYYFKTTVSTTSNVTAYSCGTSTDPSTCSSSGTTSISANTWYKVTSTPSVTFKANGSIYARINDGYSYLTSETLTVGNIDTTAPSAAVAVGTIKTDRVTLTATCSDAESGITKYEFSKDGGSTWNANGTTKTYTYTKLTQSSDYTFKVRCTNGSGLTSIGEQLGTTKGITAPTVTTTSGWATSKVVTATYTNTNINSPSYYIKSTVAGTLGSAVTQSCGTGTNPGTCTTITSTTSASANTWYKVTSTTTKLTIKANGSIYAVTSDGTNIKAATALAVTSIDTTVPSAAVAVGTIKTDRVTLTATCSDAESGITKYEFSKDGGSTWNANGTTKTYTYTKLTQSSDYTFKVRCTNGSGLTSIGEQLGTTKGITAPTVTTTSGWATSKVVTATYTNTNIANPSYYIKSTVAGTLGTAVTQSCGTGTNPGTCTTITSTTSASANTWYKVSSTTATLTIKANGSIYAVTSDGTNIKAATALAITTVDTAVPTASVSGIATSWATSDAVTLTLGDTQSGLAGYAVTTSTSTPSSYTAVSGTSASKTYTASSNGTYYVHVKDNVGRTKYTSFTISKVDNAVPTASVSDIATSWATSDAVTLTLGDTQSGLAGYAVTTSTTTPSSYTAVSGTSASKTYTATSNGTYYVHVKDAVGRTKYTSFTISKVDNAVPTASVSGIATSWATSDAVTLTLGDTQSGLAGYAVTTSTTTPSSYTAVSGTSASKTYTATSNGTYYVHVKDAVGRTKYTSFTISYVGVYSAHSSCGVNLYNRGSVCGVESYKSCAHSECGVSSYKSCATSGCGVSSYKTCAHSECGVNLYKRCSSAGVESYKSCATSGCGVSSYKTCANSACGSYSCVTSYKYYSNDSQSSCVARGGTPYNISGTSCSCKVPQYGTCYYSCATSGCGVSSYKTCAHSECGVNLYNRGSVCGVESYKSCATSGCGVSSYKTCAHSECGVSSYKTCATSGCGVNLYKRCESAGVESYKTCWHT